MQNSLYDLGVPKVLSPTFVRGIVLKLSGPAMVHFPEKTMSEGELQHYFCTCVEKKGITTIVTRSETLINLVGGIYDGETFISASDYFKESRRSLLR